MGDLEKQMLRALERALPVLEETVASGLFPAADPSDRLALDAVEEAIEAAHNADNPPTETIAADVNEIKRLADATNRLFAPNVQEIFGGRK